MGSRDRSRSRDRDRERDRRRSRSRDRSRRYERRSRSRSRDRSRERRRSRSKSRDRSRDRNKNLAYDASIGAVQAMAALQQQQQLQRQLLAQQMLLQQQAAAAAAAAALAVAPAQAAAAATSTSAATADRKAREIYVGNLAIGVVNADMLKELFNTILASQVPDPQNQPPVNSVNLDTSGRFAFVEFRTRELTDAAIQLDKLELCGRQMNIGRPKGYVDTAPQLANAAKLGQVQVALSALTGSVPTGQSTLAAAAGLTVTTPTAVVLLENMVTCATIRDEGERKEILDDVQTEAVKCGAVLGLAAPPPPATVANHEASRIYVKYGNASDAARCRTMMDGRKFDDNQVRAIFVTEGEFTRAQGGEWVARPGLLIPQGAAGLAGVPGMAPMAAAAATPTLTFPGLAGLAGLTAAAPAAAAAAPAGLVLPPGFALPAGFSLAGALPGINLPK